MQNKTLVLLLLAMPLVCSAQSATTKSSPQYRSKYLQLTVKSERETYQIGDEVTLEIRIKNISGKPLRLLNIARIISGQPGVLSIRDSSDQMPEYLCPMKTLETPTLDEFITLENGAEETKMIYAINKCYDLSKPDNYSIQCTYQSVARDKDRPGKKDDIFLGVLTSEPIIVKITQERAALSSNKELAFIYQRISEIENRCIPKRGIPRREVENIFGEGKLTSNNKLGTISPNTDCFSYELCKGGLLFVCYRNGNVLSAHYVDLEATKGRPPGAILSDEEQLAHAKRRMAQMEIIYAAYVKRIKDINAQ
jgi:hypothetical protein